MAENKKKAISKVYGNITDEQEAILFQLAIERICDDMCDFYEQFYAHQGPGVIVYVPEAKKEEDTMFYLPVKALAAAIEDFRRQDMDGPAEIMQKTIVRAEALNPDIEALFLIQGEETLSLFHYNRERPVTGPVKA